MNCILEKIENDGIVNSLQKIFQEIFQREMVYAVAELKKIKEQQPFLNFKNQLINNTLIFKENLKLITNSLIDIIWKEKVSFDRIQETILKAQKEIYKGEFEEIAELDEESYPNSWVHSTKRSFKGEESMSGRRQRNLSSGLEKMLSGEEGSSDGMLFNNKQQVCEFVDLIKKQKQSTKSVKKKFRF